MKRGKLISFVEVFNLGNHSNNQSPWNKLFGEFLQQTIIVPNDMDLEAGAAAPDTLISMIA